ncbi:Kinesin [Bachmanniomyces sp. S44760]|nr:Kinesin [Bachmanniomyces sp. S44760]
MNPDTQATNLLVPNDTDPANSRLKSRKVIEEKKFTFDNSFWSHNTSDDHYAHQEDIYNALGEEFLDHNFEGYHTCIFAYGQTGSGKSYTMMGTPEQPGLIPRTCEDLFERIESSTSPHISYTVRVSYFEVYNEHVRDLLVPSRPTTSGHPYYLKIREHPVEGPYIKDLTDVPVKSYQELLRYMRQGDASRTTASTKMNDTSSRSHAVFTIMLKQIHHDLSTDSTTERLARIRLVDLAGSERAKATEATGARLREGSNINKSLTTLGRVIAALADPRHGRIHNKSRNKDVVPYRDSILTWLLKDSLGGNSKTAMIACIAPSDYDETLSTLRYADQAKHIRTRAIVNQDSVSAAERDAQIAEMQNTIRELQVQVSLANQAAQIAPTASSRGSNGNANNESKSAARDEKLEEYQSKVERMQRLMEEERLVGESKIRQLVEQNEALRLHLKLAIESLKNPISVRSMDLDEDVQSEEVMPAASHTEEEEKEITENNRGRSIEPEPELMSDNEASASASVVDEDECFTPCPIEIVNTDTDNEALEMQSHMEDLLKDLGLFKRKIADDKLRFTNVGVQRNVRHGARDVLGSVELN